MTQINAYVTFTGNCREVMTFYKECIGGELTMQTIGGSPIETDFPPKMKNMILHASLTKGSLLLLGSDCVGPDGYTKGNNIALCVNCSSDEEINTFYTKLSAGGKIIDPLGVKFWGAVFGVFTDKFGISWMLNYNKSEQ
jgi:PhnB protein